MRDPGDPVYELTAPSRQTTLGEFRPWPTRQGVSARPWGQRRVFPGTFGVREETAAPAGRAIRPRVVRPERRGRGAARAVGRRVGGGRRNAAGAAGARDRPAVAARQQQRRRQLGTLCRLPQG